MLPYVGFGVDHAHVRLICSAVDKNPIVHLEKSVLCIVLKRTISILSMRDRRNSWLTGECCPVVALLANGSTKSWPSVPSYHQRYSIQSQKHLLSDIGFASTTSSKFPGAQNYSPLVHAFT